MMTITLMDMLLACRRVTTADGHTLGRRADHDCLRPSCYEVIRSSNRVSTPLASRSAIDGEG